MLQVKDAETGVRYSTEQKVNGKNVASDWNIDLENVRDFLAMPRLQTIVVIYNDGKRPDKRWGQVYHKQDINTLVILHHERIVGNLYRLDEKGFIFQPSYDISQEVWEYIYPDPRERAQAKLETQLFPQCETANNYGWYFVGKNSGRLYYLNSDAQIGFAGMSISQPSPELHDIGVEDGLQAEEYCPDSHYFSSDAIGNTGYERHKIDSVNKLIMTAAMCAGDVIDIIRQALTSAEYAALTSVA